MAGKIGALIIDDEDLARAIIRSYLSGHEDVEILGECSDGFEGVKSIQETKPDLIFLDVQMPKISGFEMLELLDNPPNVIFSTAYDQYAIDAFEKNAVDYLLKPYDSQRFNEALEKARLRIRDRSRPAKKDQIIKDGLGEVLSRIVVRTGPKIDIIDLPSISHITAMDDYVEIFTDRGKYVKQMTMKYLEDHLPPGEFVRTHRSHIVSVRMLKKIEHYEKDSHLALLKTGVKLPISRSGYGRLREILNF